MTDVQAERAQIAGAALPEDAGLDERLRPRSLEEMIGQDRLRENLKVFVQAARDRAEYLRRPDLGRRLSDASRGRLERGASDVAFVIADGLSALAVHRHAGPLLETLLPKLADWKVAPLVVVIMSSRSFIRCCSVSSTSGLNTTSCEPPARKPVAASAPI